MTRSLEEPRDQDDREGLCSNFRLGVRFISIPSSSTGIRGKQHGAD